MPHPSIAAAVKADNVRLIWTDGDMRRVLILRAANNDPTMPAS